jgi:hypothetical protein
MTETTGQSSKDGSEPEKQNGTHRSSKDESPVVGTSSAQTGRPQRLDTPNDVDRRGWLLVALVVLSVLVIPLFVLYLPEAHWLISRLGFSQRQAYIVFPMLPAVVLGLTAVWATVRAYSE